MIKLLLVLSMISQAPPGSSYILSDFSQSKEGSQWYVVDDRVMGGISQGEMLSLADGTGIFKGDVSTANNGGFSSVRKPIRFENKQGYNTIFLKVKGDGKSYQFRIKEKPSDQFSYIQNFKTSGQWEVIELQLRDFYPVFRGRNLRLPNFGGKFIREIAFLIGNKVNEKFALEIETIYLK